MDCSESIPRITLVTGGTRSGKSSYALSLAKNAQKPCFIATGWASDPEMAQRISKHRKERGDRWQVLETRTGVSEAIRKAETDGADFILVDCLTLWTSNIFLECENDLESKTEELVQTVQTTKVPVVFVTNEVGCGIVPANQLARRYRDAAGFVNRKVADAADALILVVCGQPLKVK